MLFGSLNPPEASAQRPYQPTGAGIKLQEAQVTAQVLQKEVRSGLNGYDTSPLGNRTPLILIHGIGASAGTDFNWERFLEVANKDSKLISRYKIYLYHYDSSRSVPDISNNLKLTLRHFIETHQEKPIKILAYSEGGLLTRNALQDPYLDHHTDEVITIATPFHGSPLANPDWVRQQIKTESRFSLMRMGQKLAYGITKKLYPSFKEDFHWDNFDGALPAEQLAQSATATSRKEYALANKKRFVTYGSYFGLEVDPALIAEKLDSTAQTPREKVLVGNLFRRNVLFSVVRHTIAKLPLASARSAAETEAHGNGPVRVSQAAANQSSNHAMLAIADTNHNSASLTPAVNPADRPVASAKTQSPPRISMMMFNDGISPISSTLWLGRYISTQQGVAISTEKLWETLKKLKGNSNTRLFAGMDHRNWMDGTTRTGQAEIQDLLNPNEPPRTIFGWIIYDLMS
jgi:pimeloyl-ACP methyl ester carboxylesterase